MDEPKNTQRRVVIVGRPNVGKSALFNRLARARIAIVHEEAGCTRDRLMREILWGDQRFTLVDTGGLCNVDNARSASVIEVGIRTQIEAALGDAATAIFVVDAISGLHPMDREVARLLRTAAVPVIVAVNKADNEERDANVTDFASLSYPVFPVSAIQDRGFEALMAAVLPLLPPAQPPDDVEPLKVAVVGRPNVGKSSFINRLLRSDRLLVSDIPGTTRDSVDVPFVIGAGPQARHYLLIDTAGLRPSAKVDTEVEQFSRIRAEKSIRRSDVVVLVVDGSDRVTAQEKRIAAMVAEFGKGCLFLINKWDIATQTQHEYETALRHFVPFMRHCPVTFISSKTGFNIRSSVEVIDHVAGQVTLDLPTGILNRTILDACERVQPPMVDGKRLKIFYCTQVGTKPIRVRVFVNNPRCVVDAYREFLVSTLRKRFGLDGAPVQFQFRGRTQKDDAPEAPRARHVARGSRAEQRRIARGDAAVEPDE